MDATAETKDLRHLQRQWPRVSKSLLFVDSSDLSTSPLAVTNQSLWIILLVFSGPALRSWLMHNPAITQVACAVRGNWTVAVMGYWPIWSTLVLFVVLIDKSTLIVISIKCFGAGSVQIVHACCMTPEYSQLHDNTVVPWGLWHTCMDEDTVVNSHRINEVTLPITGFLWHEFVSQVQWWR